jgi:hypothetical protein
MTENNDLLQNIKKIQNDFYSNTKRNIFIKKAQKSECAQSINNILPLEGLISKTVFIIPNTNRIFIDYLFFKTFALPSNFQYVIDRFISLLIQTIDTYGTFQLHIDLNTFSATAAERFQKVFQMYYESCCAIGLFYDISKIDVICIYNTPVIINILSNLIVRYTDDSIKKKIKYFNKDVSQELITNIFK